jgi:hypothetical protein
MGLDIGPDSIKTFNEALDKSQTVIWNGPMGVFEFDKFAAGTEVWRIWIFLQVLIINHSPPFFVFFFPENCLIVGDDLSVVNLDPS